MELKPNNVIKVLVTPENFLYNWLLILTPFHKLTERQTVVFAKILEEYILLNKTIEDVRTVNNILFSSGTKQKICKQCNITMEFLNVILSNMRQKGVINKNVINQKYIPKINVSGEDKMKNYSVLFYFDVTNPEVAK